MAPDHQTGYMGDFTERSSSMPLEACSGVTVKYASYNCGRWLDGPMTELFTFRPSFHPLLLSHDPDPPSREQCVASNVSPCAT